MSLAAPRSATDGDGPSWPTAGRAGRRVLLVDDAPTFRAVIARILASHGYAVREVGSVADALAAWREERPDWLLLDIDLPDRTGWDVLRELSDAGQSVPTVIVSAVRVSAARLAEFRPLAYLPKPFPIEALLRLLEHGAATDAAPEDG
jgi:CheY-like chemotaxis protein